MKSSVHTYNVLLIAQGYSTYVMVWTYQDMFTNVTLALSFPLHMNVRLIEKNTRNIEINGQIVTDFHSIICFIFNIPFSSAKYNTLYHT